MNLLLMQSNKFQGMPRSGLQMCLDPYKDTYGKNVLPVGSEKFATGWTIGDGSVATLTQDQAVAEWGTTEATRITCTAGNATITTKRFITIGNGLTGEKHTKSIYIKNVGTNNIIVAGAISEGLTTIIPGEQKKVVITYTLPFASARQINLRSDVATNGFDIIAWQPQINLGQLYPYALPSGLPTNPLNNYKNEIVQNGASLGTDSNDVSFTGLSYKMNASTNTDNYLLMPKGGEYDNQATFTCTFVLNATASGGGGYARLFDKAGSTLQGILAYVDVNGKINLSRYNGAGNYKTWTTTNAIAWGTTYIVIIKASRNLTDSAVEIFVNGVKQTLTTLVVGVPALADDSTQDLLLGNRTSLDRYFLGDFYSVDWTSKLLTDSEVAGLTKYLKTYWLNKGVTI